MALWTDPSISVYDRYMTTTLALTFTLGNRLAKARKAAGLTQEQMAERLGLGSRSIARYEGDRVTPYEAIVIAWSVVTGAPLEWLHTGEMPLPDTTPVTHGQQGAVSAYQRERLAA